MKRSLTSPRIPCRSSLAPDFNDNDVLEAELRKRHPEIFDDKIFGEKEASAMSEAPVVDPSDPQARAGLLDDFLSGRCALTLMPAAASSPAEREMYFTELVPLREALMAEFQVASPSDAMLVDVAVASLFDSRRLATKAASMIGDGLLANVRGAEIVDRMAARAHGRFVGAIDALRRARMPRVRLTVEAAEVPRTGQVAGVAKRRAR